MFQEKKIIEEVSGWLRVFDDGSVDRTWTGPPSVKFMTEPVSPHEEFINGVATRDVTINKPSNIRVRLYLPEIKPDQNHQETNKLKLPIILHFHGGGFCISQPNWFMYYHIYTRLSSSIKAIIVSVYLPLAPENRLPAAIDDGFSALLWLKSLCELETNDNNHSHNSYLKKYGDFKRVFLIGDSSGGNIVHQVAVRASDVDLSPLRLAGAIPVHPGFVRPERSKSESEEPESPFLTLEMVDKFLSLALPIGCNKEHPITCPMGSEALQSLESLKLPPILVCIAEKDLIKDTEMEYCEVLKKGKKEVEIFMSYGMGHSFYLNKIAVDLDPATAAQTERLIAGIKEFVIMH